MPGNGKLPVTINGQGRFMGIRTALRAGLFALVFAASAASAQVTFNRGYDADPETLDPHKTSTVSEAHLIRDLFENLVVHDSRGRVAPGVAESWTLSPDGKSYTFNLRANARWSNGDPVVAADFEYSLKRIMDPATGAKYANILYPILNAEAFNKAVCANRAQCDASIAFYFAERSAVRA